jgi:hypothetical protein
VLATLLDAGNSRKHPEEVAGDRAVGDRQQVLSPQASAVMDIGVKLSFDGKLKGPLRDLNHTAPVPLGGIR